MLLFPNTRIELSNERPLLPGVIISEEGAALVAAYSAGAFGLKEATGAAAEVFAGVSLSRPLSPAAVPVIESLVVPVSGSVKLKAVPNAGSLRVVDKAANTAYTVGTGAPAGATDVGSAAGSDTLVFQPGQAGKTVIVTYVRSLTVAQAILLIGNQDVGGPAGAYFGQVGVITRGDVYTTEFDTLADWSNPTDLRLSANGKFTVGGTGTKVPGYVISAPAEGAAFLGIHFAAN